MVDGDADEFQKGFLHWKSWVGSAIENLNWCGTLH